MVKSMTGYGRGEYIDEKKSITVEIKAVNHRYCDVYVKMPRRYSFAEERIKSDVRDALKRGKIEVLVTVDSFGESENDIRLNEDVARKYYRALKALEETFELDQKGGVTLSMLPGLEYRYPPEQDKVPFKEISAELSEKLDSDPEAAADPKYLLSHIQGISPGISRELARSGNPVERLEEILESVENGTAAPRVYLDETGKPLEFHLTELGEYVGAQEKTFDSISEATEYFYTHREESNAIRQRSNPLHRSVQASLDKARLKKQRLGEDLLQAENSEKYRLYGELLTANLHRVEPGAHEVTVISYYDNQPVTIPLDEKYAASKNAQNYFKKYSKAKTAVHEKTHQLEETSKDILYLESVLQSIESAHTLDELNQIREELEDTGYVRKRAQKGFRRKKSKPQPIEYTLPTGQKVFVGRNNKENDYLTTKMAGKRDLWFHTKDIPGSHVILPLEPNQSPEDIPEETIYQVASIAAYHSKGKESQNVPVDFVPIRYVKKPSGAKPGMVIFTHNTTVYVDPKLPESAAGK